jgi:hypothetical protein
LSARQVMTALAVKAAPYMTGSPAAARAVTTATLART